MTEPSRDLPKTFDPAAIEARWYAHWETNGLFRPDRPGAEPWTIVNPPPNVTGSLHIGHALDNTLQDILTRHARLKGKDALWVVGTDHAGIATQMVVERQMAAKGEKRTDLSRDEFVNRVWQWKEESGGAITAQLRRLGCSMDWANERFTMDEGFSKAVLKVFVDLYNDKLLYRDKRLVNWDRGLGTAISDLEVETREVKGSFWQIRYPLADGSGTITVATTRPETMLADMAVAVHPDDERYRGMIGQQVRLPITDRLIPVIADEHADPALGTGAVKITPGHDFNDFEVGKRAGMKAGDMLNMLDAKARVVQTAAGGIPDEFIGLERDAARRLVVERLKEGGFLVAHVDKDGIEHDAEPRTIQTPYGDRSGVVIEPWLTDQWYVDAATLAKPAIEAVRSGAIRLVPKTWEKTFFNWMENIQPWCVSRQLWWGHRIPAWFGPSKDAQGNWQIVHDPVAANVDPAIFVALSLEDAIAQAAEFYNVSPDDVAEVLSSWSAVGWPFEDKLYGENSGPAELASERPVDRTRIPIWQDSDVLDTWFSSALWPFATLDWPDNTDPTLAGRYPNDVLVSGFDILFFWDARMMMQGMHFMGQNGERKPEDSVPFRTLYLHGLVRAADGAKMSKSKGNTVDPLGLIDRYGADALRFFMAAMESQGRDIKMDEKRVEGYRNFATKLWNASRFCQANGIGGGIGGSASLEPPAATLAVNKWIIGQAIRTVQAVDLALAEYRFDAAANAVYQFVWSRFCDWYLELIKPVVGKADGGAIDDDTKAVAGWVLDTILVLLHPFMPFITEELWHALAPRDHDLIVAHWPMADARALDPKAEAEVEWLIRLVSEVRAARAEVNVPPGARTNLIVLEQKVAIGGGLASTVPAPELTERIRRNRLALHRLSRIDVVEFINTGIAIDLGSGEEFNRVTYQPSLKGRLQLVVDGIEYVILVGDLIDLPAEEARLRRTLATVEKERDALAGRLNNASFVERAKTEAVEKARADHADKTAEAERLGAALARLG